MSFFKFVTSQHRQRNEKKRDLARLTASESPHGVDPLFSSMLAMCFTHTHCSEKTATSKIKKKEYDNYEQSVSASTAIYWCAFAHAVLYVDKYHEKAHLLPRIIQPCRISNAVHFFSIACRLRWTECPQMWWWSGRKNGRRLRREKETREERMRCFVTGYCNSIQLSDWKS